MLSLSQEAVSYTHLDVYKRQKLFFDVWFLYVLRLRYFGFIVKYEEMVCGSGHRSGRKVYGKEQSVILRDKEVGSGKEF